MRQCLVSLLARGRAADPPPAPRRARLSLRMFTPDHVSVVVRRRGPNETVPHLGAPKIFLGGLARDLALEHDVAVVGRADDAPAVLAQVVEEPGDLGQALWLLGDVFAEPGGVGPLARARIVAVELVTDGPEHVDEDVGRTGHGQSLGLAPLLHEAVATIGVLRDDDERVLLEARLSLQLRADEVVVLVLGRNADAGLRLDLRIEAPRADPQGDPFAGIREQLPRVLGDQDPGLADVL